MVVVIPLFDAQSCIPRSFYPDVLADLHASYSHDYGDFLVAEPPLFFVGLVWFEVAFHWPLCLANLAGVLGSKSWFPTTCLVYGVSVVTSMAAILPELIWSPKTSDKIKMIYFPFLGVAVLAVVRGIFPWHGNSSSGSSTGHSLAKKKRT
ncbi:hypothetical protein MLD38_003052 [Melastoma candidum]|nr:hypothetical protein MLD38_003052 [Melastoma candidum]